MQAPWKWLGLVFWAWLTGQSPAAPTILITNLPAYNSSNDLRGLVMDADPAAYAVAVFIYVPDYGWVTKPTCAQPLTPIQPGGTWTTDITTGGSDPLATRIAALLVGTNYNQPCVDGAAVLSTNIYAQAIAKTIVTRPVPGVRRIAFSGYEWWVKASAGLAGPGPNFFSDSTNNVWVDAQDRLHLRITNRSNQWQCAELVSARSFGCGSYRFEPAARVDNLDPNIVLGLFTWSDDPAYSFREMDIECSRWGNASDPSDAQYVVQPFDAAGHLARFAVPAGLTNSTLLFTWETNRISFESQRGSYSNSPAPSSVISNWTYNLLVPQAGDENARINLWLYGGLAPSDAQEAEVVLQSFEYVPLGPAAGVCLTNLSRPADSAFHFSIGSQPDRRYEWEISTNLHDWESRASVLATNSRIDFLDTNAPAFPQRFHRVLTLP